MEYSFHLQFGLRVQRGVGLVYMLICMANRAFAGASRPRWLHFLSQIGKSKVFSLACDPGSASLDAGSSEDAGAAQNAGIIEDASSLGFGPGIGKKRFRRSVLSLT
jgi:hypothetical protein